MKKKLALIICIFILACSSDKEIAGASTVETENACIINIVNVDTKPAAYAVAKIRPLWHVQRISPSDSSTFSNATKDETLEIIADSLGNIMMDSVKFEKGYIEIIDGNAGLFKSIALSDLKKNKTTKMQMETLGSVSGKAILPEGSDYAWIQIYGTDRIIKTNKEGNFTIDSLPPASYQIQAILSDEKSAIGIANVTVSAGEKSNANTLVQPTLETEQLEQWAFSRTIPLDSTISDWMKPIAESTVVFVRLSAENFNFSEAMTNGNDIRFTDQNGNRLAFKRAFWNSTTPDAPQAAEFQVRINGTSNVENLVMYWGKTAALDASSNVWEGLPDSLVKAIHSIKLIDFEKQKLESTLEYGDGHREWYFNPQDSNVTTTPAKENASDGIEKNEERNSYVFHWKSTSKVKGKWSMIGSRVNRIPSSLEGIDSIAFYAKGAGELGFAIEALEEPTGKTKYVDYLDSSWKRFCFTPKDFVEGDGEYGNMGWEFVKARVTTFTIWIVDDSEMWIDDVILYGVNRDNFN